MWLRTLEDSLVTTLDYRLTGLYPGITVEKTAFSKTTPSFPHVQVYMLESPERGQTFDKSSLNAAMVGFQLTVATNKSESLCEEIADKVADMMLKNFDMVCQPIPDYDGGNNVYQYTMRFQRLIGYNDIVPLIDIEGL